MRNTLRFSALSMLFITCLLSVWAQSPADWQLRYVHAGISLGNDQPFSGNRDFLVEQLWNRDAAVLFPNGNIVDRARPGASPRFQLGLNLEKYNRRGHLRYLRIQLEVMPQQHNQYHFDSGRPDFFPEIWVSQGELNFSLDYRQAWRWNRFKLKVGLGLKGGSSFGTEFIQTDKRLWFTDDPDFPGFGLLPMRSANPGQPPAPSQALVVETRLLDLAARGSTFFRAFLPLSLEVQLSSRLSAELGAETGVGVQHILGGSSYKLPVYGRLSAGCLFLLGP